MLKKATNNLDRKIERSMVEMATDGATWTVVQEATKLLQLKKLMMEVDR